MLTKEGIASLRERLAAIRKAGAEYFDHAVPVKIEQGYAGHSWKPASEEQRAELDGLRSTIKNLSVDIAGAARGSPLIAEADL